MGITSYLAGGGMGGAAAMAAQAAELGGTGTTMAALGGMALAGAANSAFRSVEHGVTAGAEFFVFGKNGLKIRNHWGRSAGYESAARRNARRHFDLQVLGHP